MTTKNWICLTIFAGMLLIYLNSCKKDDNNTTPEKPFQVTDIDGNVYHSITIGTQVWMSENLRTTHYRNGDSIPNTTSNTVWSNLSTGAYCNYGKTTLYNWYAATDSRNIAPIGWHVPTDAEWDKLTSFLGGESVAGSEMESYGFKATGSRNSNGGFEYPDYGDWWASTSCGPLYGHHRGHLAGQTAIYNICFNNKYGFCIRCVKD